MVGAAAVGSGIPETLRGFGLMIGARRGVAAGRRPPDRWPRGEIGAEPLVRTSVEMPRCCWRFDTSDVLETFWLSYGEDGLMAR